MNIQGGGLSFEMCIRDSFKVGDFIMLKVGAKAYKITSINTSETLYDTINVGTTLGNIHYLYPV